MPKNGQFLRDFEKLKTYGQTELPKRSILIGRKFAETAKVKKSNATFWMD